MAVMRTLADIRPFDAMLEHTSMSSLLADFRKFVEKGAGAPVERLEVNAALLLSDLCKFLKLGAAQRQKVLGRSAAAYVESVLAERVTLPVIY